MCRRSLPPPILGWLLIIHHSDNGDNKLLRNICKYTYPDDESNKFLWNVDKYLSDYTELHPRRHQSSYYNRCNDRCFRRVSVKSHFQVSFSPMDKEGVTSIFIVSRAFIVKDWQSWQRITIIAFVIVKSPRGTNREWIKAREIWLVVVLQYLC